MSDFSNENFPKETDETPQETSPMVTTPADTPAPGVLTDKMIFHLKGAAPWLRFVSIAGFVSLGILLIAILILAVAGSGSGVFDELGLGGVGNSLIFLTYIPFLAISFFYMYFALQFGNRIKTYLQTKDHTDLEEAFKNNKSMWTLSGVLVIISLAFSALAIVIGIIVGIITAVGVASSLL